MTVDTNTVDMDDLDSFETAFFDKPGNKAPEAKPTEAEEDQTEDEIEEIEEDALATEEEEETDEEELEEEDEEPEPKPEPKKNRNSAQERIRELVAKTREAERREAALLQRLEALEARKEVDEKKPTQVRASSDDSPKPDAVNEAGDAMYPLGEFDPAFIRDLTRYTIKQENAAAEQQRSLSEQERVIQAAQEELRTSWASKVTEAEKEMPDLREKLDDMTDTFSNIEPAYGEYLAATIMSCDAGPQIMYYLSQNIGEAQKIVASGPAAATLAIGRLEARLSNSAPEPKRNTKQVSKAPLPPEQRTRGAGSKFTVSPDTDDLDAFEREFFKAKGRR